MFKVNENLTDCELRCIICFINVRQLEACEVTGRPVKFVVIMHWHNPNYEGKKRVHNFNNGHENFHNSEG